MALCLVGFKAVGETRQLCDVFMAGGESVGQTRRELRSSIDASKAIPFADPGSAKAGPAWVLSGH